MGVSASGVRIQGDDYQHLFAWYKALQTLAPDGDVETVAVEAEEAGYVDDVVVMRSSRPAEYVQVKYSVDARHPIDSHWWITSTRRNGTSPLAKFWTSWQKLTSRGVRPEMVLFTNRPLDVHDPLLRLRSGRHGRLTPAAAETARGSQAGRVRKMWAEHLGVGEVDLLAMLDHLELKTDQGPWSDLVERTADRMAAAGLRSDDLAVESGVASIRSWVTSGVREIGRGLIEAEVERRGLRADFSAWATLLVQAIDRDLWPDSATVSLDWVDLFDGDEPRARRQLLDPSLWNQRLRPDVVAAIAAIRGRGYDRVRVRGFMRLPIWFLVGAELPEVRGHRVVCRQREQSWSSEATPARFEIRTSGTKLERGPDLAVGLSVTNDLSRDVLQYISAVGLRVGNYLDVAPQDGPTRTALSGAEQALGWATTTREVVRDIVRASSSQKIHLFMAGPAGGALLLGHLWNRMPVTQLYEDLGPGSGYAPTFLIPA